jgi:hypothetical protein
MVGAVGLIVGEITTGHSFSEQFIDLLSQQWVWKQEDELQTTLFYDMKKRMY